ncbi:MULTISPECIES: tripartite tricarboxylate transporter substrate binding protein [unclassified Variovorax]|jgi:tripartite-type tricarboxylate transporter receptor subunit TctC|uniref:Bug family tripartite tricarboxylate transporter substrate binding protein n=1 Tax=unclassified Variovorax TaxID=663243 RepID=UPI000F7E87A5|nr:MULTISPECIES: tripartite tricarboxylate transporter substrate binding protein [unclassified Variovorax]RSZ42628.1 tripartite tricarboxylate transporter substrate binding protein [Variovorax sp. 553]RSZ43603.1 tripartite tricarboxylate transporter substrate binding protein [Variovorax sp. 679]
MFFTARRALLACAAAAAWLNAAPALADTAWPDKPVRLIVPYTPGGATDIVARLVAQKLSDDTRWTFIVDNRAGGNGNIGMDVVAKAKPDGYTIGLGQTANLAINPTLFPKMPYDALKDLVPVSVVASQPVVLVVRADAPFKSLADLVAAAKAKPGEIRQALAGTGTLGHMAGEVLAKRAGFKVLNVPYKGAAPAITDLLGGQTDYMFATPQGALAMVKGGKLRALAVTSAKRLPVMPEVPTVGESYKGFEAVDWKALVAPAGTPADIVKKLSAAVDKALAKPATISQLLAEGSTPVGGSAEQAAQYIKAEHARWGAAVREAGVRPE